MKQAISPWLRRLDFLPARWAWAAGLSFGALAGASLTGPVPRVIGVFVFLALLVVAASLAWSSELIAIEERPPQQASEPIAIQEKTPWQAPEPVYASRFVDLVSIPGGTFQMGSPESEEGRFDYEGPVHEAHVSPFACMRYPVTRRLYAEITGSDLGWPEGDADERPVNNVSWYDAVSFCNKLSKREGLTPCYRIVGRWVAWKSAADGYRLLTEAEWEYACRAGSATRWSFGDDEAALGDHAWFRGNADVPRLVGGKTPNLWGLHDMHGNVNEWCWDWFGSYLQAAETDPHSPPRGEGRMFRGGAFGDSPGDLRSAFRGRGEPAGRYWGIGFRCARGPALPPGEGGTGLLVGWRRPSPGRVGGRWERGRG